jgi:hypothetical protein
MKSLFKALCLFMGWQMAHANLVQNELKVWSVTRESPEQWVLQWKNTKIGPLETIGGAPQITQVEQVKGPGGKKLYLIQYFGGAAGTRTMTLLERLAVVPDSSTPKIALDIAIRLTRTDGEQVVLKFDRKLSWTSDYSQLDVGPLDEFHAEKFKLNSNGRFSKH